MILGSWDSVGVVEGIDDGNTVTDGPIDGAIEGKTVSVGVKDGSCEGCSVSVGRMDGCWEGLDVCVGLSLGETLGMAVVGETLEGEAVTVGDAVGLSVLSNTFPAVVDVLVVAVEVASVVVSTLAEVSSTPVVVVSTVLSSATVVSVGTILLLLVLLVASVVSVVTLLVHVVLPVVVDERTSSSNDVVVIMADVKNSLSTKEEVVGSTENPSVVVPVVVCSSVPSEASLNPKEFPCSSKASIESCSSLVRFAGAIQESTKLLVVSPTFVSPN